MVFHLSEAPQSAALRAVLLSGRLFQEERDAVQERIIQFLAVTTRRYVTNYAALCSNGLQACHEQDLATRKELFGSTDDLIRLGHDLELMISNRRLVKVVQHLFRESIADLYRNNPFVKRCLEKPRGYPGDFQTLEEIYEYPSTQRVVPYGPLDLYLLDHAHCVRTRKDKIMTLIIEELTALKERMNQHILVVTIGSGPCREWLDMPEDCLTNAKRTVDLVCVDRDDQALTFAKSSLSAHGLLHSTQLTRQSMLDFLRRGIDSEIIRGMKPHLIYSVGIADYCHNEMLKGIICRAANMLREGGQMIFTHKDRARFKVVPSAWLCDWKFVPRSEDEFRTLLRHALSSVDGAYSLNIGRDTSGQVLVGTMRKLKEECGGERV